MNDSRFGGLHALPQPSLLHCHRKLRAGTSDRLLSYQTKLEEP